MDKFIGNEVIIERVFNYTLSTQELNSTKYIAWFDNCNIFKDFDELGICRSGISTDNDKYIVIKCIRYISNYFTPMC